MFDYPNPEPLVILAQNLVRALQEDKPSEEHHVLMSLGPVYLFVSVFRAGSQVVTFRVEAVSQGSSTDCPSTSQPCLA